MHLPGGDVTFWGYIKLNGEYPGHVETMNLESLYDAGHTTTAIVQR